MGEREFWEAVVAAHSRGEFPRDVIGRPGFDVPAKRAHRWLEKWVRQGKYEYGVTLDLGWPITRGEAEK